MVVTIKQRIIRRGGVSPPSLETQRFTAKFVNLWLLYLSGGETPPLRTAYLIQISPTAKFQFIELFNIRRSEFDRHSHPFLPPPQKTPTEKNGEGYIL